MKTNIKTSSVIKIKTIPNHLIKNLPIEDQTAILEIINTKQVVENISDIGLMEINFKDKNQNYHTIWLDISHVELVD